MKVRLPMCRRRLCVNVDGGGPHYYVAVSGGRHQNALAHFRGQLEQSGVGDIAVSLVQQFVFAFTRGDAVFLFAQHIVYFVAVNARAVDYGVGVVAGRPFR